MHINKDIDFIAKIAMVPSGKTGIMPPPCKLWKDLDDGSYGSPFKTPLFSVHSNSKNTCSQFLIFVYPGHYVTEPERSICA